MKLLSIEKAGSEFIIWYADNINYIKAIVSHDNHIDIDATVQISKYPAGKYGGKKKLTGYEYFAAVMGKFNPYTVFMTNPVEVQALTYHAILEAWGDFNYRPGREFGSANPTVIYVALRWNGENPTREEEEKMVSKVAKKLNVTKEELRIYNLVAPKRDKGMKISIDEIDEIKRSVRDITAFVDGDKRIKRIIVGGVSGPMPIVAVLLKHILPDISVEIRNHHKARPSTAIPLELVKVL